MPQPIPPPGMFEMSPFQIPTNVNPQVRTGPRMNLTFPVFTPPAASSYGSTMPISVPFTPPNLGQALSAGLEAGAKLGTQFMQNRKTAAEVQAEEQALKMGLAATADPARRAQMGVQFGAGGATVTLPSGLDIATRQAQLGETQAKTAETRAATAKTYGQTPESQADIALRQAEALQKQRQAELIYTNEYNRIKAGAPSNPSGFYTNPQGSTNPQATTNPQGNTTSMDYLNPDY